MRVRVLAMLAAASLAVSVGSASAEMAGNVQVARIAPDLPHSVRPGPGQPLVARVDLSEQRMYVYLAAQLIYIFPVSSGRRGYGTPTGEWFASWLSPNHRSRQYDDAPMPWAVFFHEGYAVHGTYDVRNLGRPASHGCIRLALPDAETFFRLVETSGKESTLVVVVP